MHMQHKVRSVVLVGVLLAASSEPRAAGTESSTRGLEMAFRSGILIPGGDVQTYTFPDDEGGPDSISNWFGSQIPLWVDVGYRLDRWFFGGYVQYAYGFASCPTVSNCSAWAMRTGIESQFHPVDWKLIDPWFEIGFGYEWNSYSVTTSVPSTTFHFSTTFHGVEFLRLGVGADFAVARDLRLGPFMEFSLGEFLGLSSSAAVPALHFWFGVGLKLTWAP
jgi:hypothetical protein